ncbi:putative DNA repair protein YkoV [compost metagenome]
MSAQTEKTITILDFVDLTDIDPIYFQKTYYLSPDQAGANAYQLLLEAMHQSGKIGIAKIAIRSKSSLAAIRVMEGCLAVETIFYPDEIRPISQVPNLPENLSVNEKELSMAKLLIEQLSTPFDPGKYNDDYRESLLHLIEQKIAGEEISLAPAKPQSNVIDLMAALQASIEAVKPVVTDPGPAKRTRKTAAKKQDTGTAGNGDAPLNDEGAPKPKKRASSKAKKTIS